MASFTAQQAEATLKPQFEKYMQQFDNQNWEAAQQFFHPDAVLVMKGKESTFEPEAIIANMAKFGEMSGKSKSTVVNIKYEGTEDYLIASGSMSSETEKMGTAKGNFVMIWKKMGDRHLIYHDEFEITP